MSEQTDRQIARVEACHADVISAIQAYSADPENSERREEIKNRAAFDAEYCTLCELDATRAAR